MTMLSVRDLEISNAHGISLVRDVDLDIAAGQAVGLVGESGSGKTLTLRAIMGLLPGAMRQSGGTIQFDGADLASLSSRQLRSVRGGRIGMVFQEAATALNPLMRVGAQLAEVAQLHLGLGSRASAELAIDWLSRVGIAGAEQRARAYPFELSGGMAQRVMIALALIAEPDLILCDEPTTALDVTVQAQVLRMLQRLSAELGAGLLFVTHDLAVVSQICQEVNVMYAGTVVERGSVRSVFGDPRHPYSRALLGADPAVGQRGERLLTIPGTSPAADALPTGCSFQPRCSMHQPDCATGHLILQPIGEQRATSCRHHPLLISQGAR